MSIYADKEPVLTDEMRLISAMKGSDPQKCRKDHSSCAEQLPSIIEPQETEDPFSSVRDRGLLLRPGAAWTGRAIKKPSKTHSDERCNRAERESPLRAPLRQRSENGLETKRMWHTALEAGI